MQERLERGRLVALPLKTLDNGMTFCWDVLWRRERLLGVGVFGGGDGEGQGGAGGQPPP